MGNEEPGAASGFLLGKRRNGVVLKRLGEDGDSAGAGAGSEVGRVVVEGVDERDDGNVQSALR